MATLDVLFQRPDGAEELKTFASRPLGVEFPRRMPLTVTSAHSNSQQLGVQEGWVLKAVGGENLENMDYNRAWETLKQAVVPLKPEFLPLDEPTATPSVLEMAARLAPVETSAVPSFLRKFSFRADTPSTWEKGAKRPQLMLGVISGHCEKGEHTWYRLECCLAAQEAMRCWQLERRLTQLRALLHDPLRAELGDKYEKLFANAHFARRTAPKGTTARLEAWFSALAGAVNTGRLSPKLTARLLRFLEAPELPEAEPAAEGVEVVEAVEEKAVEEGAVEDVVEREDAEEERPEDYITKISV